MAASNNNQQSWKKHQQELWPQWQVTAKGEEAAAGREQKTTKVITATARMVMAVAVRIGRQKAVISNKRVAAVGERPKTIISSSGLSKGNSGYGDKQI